MVNPRHARTTAENALIHPGSQLRRWFRKTAVLKMI